MRAAAPGVILLAALASWSCTARTERVWHEEAGHRWTELDVPQGGQAGFEEVAASKTGVTFVNSLREEQFLANRHYVNGSGVAAGDVDGDGLPDLYFAHLDGPNVLYRNLGGWRFEDVTEAAGVAAPDRFSTGAALADLDGDGDLDLLVTAMGGPNAVFFNDGTGRFAEATEASGLASGEGSTTMALSDVDGDGDLDLYVANYKKHTVKDLYPPDVRAFERVVVRDGDGYKVRPEFQEHYRIELQGNRLMRFEYAEPDRFYLNDGRGRFTEVPFTGGAFLDEVGRPLAEPPRDWALTARFQDADGDGDPDLYVCNDFESPDHFWLGDGRGRFRAAPRLALRKTSQSTMSVDFSDVDRDGDLDFFLADMLSREYVRRQAQVKMPPPTLSKIGEIEDRPQEMQNALELNRGDGTYAETAYLAGVAASDWTWSSVFLDVDLDGYEDLLTTNGHAYDAMNADAQLRTENAPLKEWRKTLLMFPDLDLQNVVFRNRGDGSFEAMPEGWGLGARPDVANALALADLDQDGDLDAVLNRLNAPAGLFRNRTPAPRLAVQLRGQAPNTAGVGARILVRAPGLPLQQKEVVLGGQYLSSSQPLYSFAAAPAAEAPDGLEIEVRWRSGRRSVVSGARADRLYEIDEPAPGEIDAAVPEADSARAPVVLFEEVSRLLGHRHHEEAFDDFARQPLLPRRLSRQGPAVALADVDRDGDPDVLVGSGRGGRLAFFTNEGAGRFRGAAVGPVAEGDQTGLAVVPDPEGGAWVFLGVSNYERAPGDSSYIARYRVDRAGRWQALAPLPFGLSSVGPLAAGDLDGDGDVDLLAGDQGVPGRYPEAGASRLYRNEGAGRFRYDAAWSASLAGTGPVSSVALGDLDGDGRQDVVLAQAWGPVRIFVGEPGGGFAERTEAYGLSAYRGWWNGVALGDFDADGRLDVAATNWGWNSAYGRGSEEGHGLRLYWGDYDGNGRLDVLEAIYASPPGGYVPFRDLASLSTGLPMVRRRVRTFAQFSESLLEDVVGPSLAGGRYLEAETLASMVFLNRGDVFEGRALPVEAQQTVGYAVLVGDYDEDGREDVFVGQNDFALPVGEARQDAGRGLWLRGDGRGGFAAVPGSVSGVRVYGEQRGAALGDYDGDGRVDVLVSQNGGETKLYRNVGEKEGLRVRLEGPPGNEWGLGAAVRLRYRGGVWGPLRVVGGVSGYRGQSSAEQVLGLAGEVEGVWVRWPGGVEQEVEVSPDTPAVTISYAGGEGA